MSAFRTSESPRPRTRPGKPKKRRGGGGARRAAKKKSEIPGAEVEKKIKVPVGPLTGKAIRHLRGLGHHLDPVVQIGKDGLSEPFIRAVREALRVHELVKVRVLAEAPIDRHEAGEALAAETGATLVQTLGRTLLVYLRHPSKPKVTFPE